MAKYTVINYNEEILREIKGLREDLREVITIIKRYL